MTIKDEEIPLTQKEIEDIIYVVFYNGELGGAKERLAAAIWKRVEDHAKLAVLNHIRR